MKEELKLTKKLLQHCHPIRAFIHTEAHVRQLLLNKRLKGNKNTLILQKLANAMLKKVEDGCDEDDTKNKFVYRQDKQGEKVICRKETLKILLNRGQENFSDACSYDIEELSDTESQSYLKVSGSHSIFFDKKNARY